jgi:parallel beta-helix repeat protein
VIIDGPGSGYGFSINNKQYIVISGFEFKDWERAIYITGASGKTYSSSGASKYIMIENNIFYANEGRGVFIQTSDHITVRKNTVTTPDLAYAQTDAIYSQRNHQNTYENNTIIISNRGGGHNDGVQLFQDTDIIVRNNYIEQDNSKVNDAQGIFATEMYGTTLYYNNVVNMTNVKSNSITFKTQNGASVEIIGNTVYGVRPYHGIWVVGVADPIVKNNIVYLISGSTLDLSGNDLGVSNNYTSNPEFLSVVERDFRLKGTSPAIDAGVPLEAPYNIDINGTPRPQGSGWDIGAFEYTNE